MGHFVDSQTAIKIFKKNRKKLKQLFMTILGLTESFETIKKNRKDFSYCMFHTKRRECNHIKTGHCSPSKFTDLSHYIIQALMGPYSVQFGQNLEPISQQIKTQTNKKMIKNKIYLPKLYQSFPYIQPRRFAHRPSQ